jgi:hypothetical protein
MPREETKSCQGDTQTVGSVPTPREETKLCQGDAQTVGSVPTPEVVCNNTQIIKVKEA